MLRGVERAKNHGTLFAGVYPGGTPIALSASQHRLASSLLFQEAHLKGGFFDD
ncbi:MAG: hypothetical protein ACOX50_02320 [Patescibacteria group bacterium]